MKTVAEIRVANLELLIKQFGTLEALASEAGTSSVYLSQIRNRTPDVKTQRPREMGKDIAKRLAEAAGYDAAWMDADHSAQASKSSVTGAAEKAGAEQSDWPFGLISKEAWRNLDQSVKDLAERAALEAVMRERERLRAVAAQEAAGETAAPHLTPKAVTLAARFDSITEPLRRQNAYSAMIGILKALGGIDDPSPKEEPLQPRSGEHAPHS